MDDSVLQAMAKWPDVPECFGWLRLDARGRWRVPSGLIEHPRMIEFIGRNYTHDAQGRWYFQNGPQRVYVDLEYAPWVYRLRAGQMLDHIGRSAGPLEQAWIDEAGAVVLRTSAGIGLIDDRDMADLPCDWHEPSGRGWLPWDGRRVPLVPIRRDQVPELGGFVRQPGRAGTSC